MSWGEFFYMGGYWFYVWGSYGVTALFILIEVVMVLRRHRTTLARLARLARSKKG